MLFVLLSYGGWNEAAYISAEIKNKQRNIVRSLLWSIGIITVIYFLVNLAYLKGLGLEAMGQSQAVAADLMQQALGERGAIIISLLIVIASLGSLNATIFTGARSNYALGQDFPRLSFLKSSGSRSSPTGAMLVQGAIAIVLVVLGTLTRRGFETMVDFTAPVFWFFFLLTGISLLVLRMREPDVQRPFQVPLYPLTPLLFCVVCAYLFYSSLAYTGIGAIASILVVGLGIPLWQWHQSN
jgi:basic amino acid/polyamine antiporter, APA family